MELETMVKELTRTYRRRWWQPFHHRITEDQAREVLEFTVFMVDPPIENYGLLRERKGLSVFVPMELLTGNPEDDDALMEANTSASQFFPA